MTSVDVEDDPTISEHWTLTIHGKSFPQNPTYQWQKDPSESSEGKLDSLSVLPIAEVISQVEQ